MTQTTVPVNETTLRKLQELAEWSGLSIPEALELAIKEQHDRKFWEAVNAGYAEMRADPKAWAEEEAERRAWEATLTDGLDRTERWANDGTPLPPADGGQSG